MRDQHAGAAVAPSPARAAARAPPPRCAGRGCRWARRRAAGAGECTSARAIATRCSSPPESSRGRRVAEPRDPRTRASRRRARAGVAHRPQQLQRQRDVLRDGEVGQHVEGLEHEAHLRAAQQRGRVVVERAEVDVVEHDAPESGRSRPASRFSSVDLPTPDSPMIATISPARDRERHRLKSGRGGGPGQVRASPVRTITAGREYRHGAAASQRARHALSVAAAGRRLASGTPMDAADAHPRTGLPPLVRAPADREPPVARHRRLSLDPDGDDLRDDRGGESIRGARGPRRGRGRRGAHLYAWLRFTRYPARRTSPAGDVRGLSAYGKLDVRGRAARPDRGPGAHDARALPPLQPRMDDRVTSATEARRPRVRVRRSASRSPARSSARSSRESSTCGQVAGVPAAARTGTSRRRAASLVEASR